MMGIEELKDELKIYLKILGISEWEHLTLGHGTAHQFVIEQFGIVLCALEQDDIKLVATKIYEFYKDYRITYVTPDDDLNKKKEDILWDFTRGGYIRWLRINYPRKFNQTIVDQGLGTKLLKERIAGYKNKPKYNFWIEEDKDALKTPTSYLLSIEPGFFDFLPEKEDL